MKGWWEISRRKPFQATDDTTLVVKSCKACHPDPYGYKGTRDKAYKYIGPYMRGGS